MTLGPQLQVREPRTINEAIVRTYQEFIGGGIPADWAGLLTLQVHGSGRGDIHVTLCERSNASLDDPAVFLATLRRGLAGT